MSRCTKCRQLAYCDERKCGYCNTKLVHNQKAQKRKEKK